MAKKSGFRIGEICRELDLQPYVLRYWETEFPSLQGSTTSGAQRSYSEHEVDALRRIKRLLYEEGYTIAGAKKKLESELSSGFGLSPGEPSLFASEVSASAPPNEETGASIPAAPLDSAVAQRIELARSGLTAALDEARGLQSLLRGDPARRSR